MFYHSKRYFPNSENLTAKEMRPDGSTANSWPSGHTATSFVGATILHKEYGLTRSPWYSIAGYSLATAKDYKDFEMYVDWRILSVQGDSGLYLRGAPQVQI